MPGLPYWISPDHFSGTTPADLQLRIDTTWNYEVKDALVRIKANDLNSIQGTVEVEVVLGQQVYLPLTTK